MASKRQRRRAVIRKITVLLPISDIPFCGYLMSSNVTKLEEWKTILIYVALKLLVIWLEYQWEDLADPPP